MDLKDKLSELKNRIERQADSVLTEEATKTAFVLPFLQSLGYDIFNPSEVVPELTADHGVKKGEKVDYAIKQDGKIVMLIECKTIGADLEAKHAGQLFRYFSVTDARFAVLTDGIRYIFFTDLDKENKMDERPFFDFNLLDYRESDVDELKKFARHSFDIDTILDTATNLKYHKAILAQIKSDYESPSEELVRMYVSRVYNGRITSQIKEQFTVLTARAMKDFVRSRINERLKSALDGETPTEKYLSIEDETEHQVTADASTGIETTDEEWEGYRIIQAIGSEITDPSRIVMRDAKSYCAILLDNNNRKAICRFYFGKKRKAIAIFSPNTDDKIDIDSIPMIYSHKKLVLSAIKQYLVDSAEKEESVL